METLPISWLHTRHPVLGFGLCRFWKWNWKVVGKEVLFPVSVGTVETVHNLQSDIYAEINKETWLFNVSIMPVSAQ